MAFYTGTEIRDKALIGHRDGTEYQILDDAAVFRVSLQQTVLRTQQSIHMLFLSNEHFWGEDLTKLAGVEEAVTGYMEDIRALGMRAAMEKTFNA